MVYVPLNVETRTRRKYRERKWNRKWHLINFQIYGRVSKVFQFQLPDHRCENITLVERTF